MSTVPNRRTFLRNAAALAAASVVGCRSSEEGSIIRVAPTTEESAGMGAEESNAPTMSDGQPALRAITLEADGSPLSAERMKTLYARDLNNDPLPQPIVLATGRARVALNRDEPIQIALRLHVPGFGEVYCYADNEGRGYTDAAQIDFVVEAAKTRLHRVAAAHERLRASGLPEDSDFNAYMFAARRPFPKSSFTARAAAYESLASSLHAGELLAMNAAKMRIVRLAAPRKDFYFGTAIHAIDSHDPVYEKRITDVFNFATANWYGWKGESAPDNDRVDYARMDSSVDWCLKNKITPKDFGYLYMIRGATPEWIRPPEQPRPATSRSATTRVDTMPESDPEPRTPHFNANWGYDRIKQTYATIIKSTMARYDGRVPYAEIMNEAHDKANLWGMTHDQILDMAKMAFTSAREGSKTVKRQMNHCCLWAEYGKRRNADGSRRWSPWQFVKACFDSGVDYEVIGVQLYYPQQDLFEIDRMMDRFAVFNRPVHITEISCSSQDGLDPESMRPRTYAPGWHGPWNPTMQADWTEAIYTLAYSKPFFEEIGWWDLVDRPGKFWPFGGLLDKDFNPKESYLRIQKLQQQWGVAKRA